MHTMECATFRHDTVEVESGLSGGLILSGDLAGRVQLNPPGYLDRGSKSTRSQLRYVTACTHLSVYNHADN